MRCWRACAGGRGVGGRGVGGCDVGGCDVGGRDVGGRGVGGRGVGGRGAGGCGAGGCGGLVCGREQGAFIQLERGPRVLCKLARGVRGGPYDPFKELAVIVRLREPQCVFEPFAFVGRCLRLFHKL
ncbi:hypothetical protein [Bartonella elizabethae]|uniref:hypothetical protein n=1 Tax=Bartonella elizabethae TaxID=807 RepID=UPI000F70A674|nr:hypothetical protein [Bartonella elizabethae]VEJ41841.1 Uncharacterised protein [Bartonella elizabethae]